MASPSRELVVTTLMPGATGDQATSGIEADPQGNLYISKGQGVFIVRPEGPSELFAGSLAEVSSICTHADGLPRLTCRLNGPRGLLWTDNEELLIVNRNSHVIKIVIDDKVYNYAGQPDIYGHRDGPASRAKFHVPISIVEHNGHYYVTDQQNNTIRVINQQTSIVTSIGAGIRNPKEGDFATGSIYKPYGLCLGHGNKLMATSRGINAIVEVDLDTQRITTVPVDLSSSFSDPGGIVAVPGDDYIICDELYHVLRRLSSKGEVSVLVGAKGPGREDGPLSTARTHNPWFICLTPSGDLYWTEGSSAVRCIKGFCEPDWAASSKLEWIDLTPLLESGVLSDIECTHQTSQHQFNLHKAVLMISHRLKSEEELAIMLEFLSKSSLPDFYIAYYFNMVYGGKLYLTLKTADLQSMMILVNLVYLSDKFGCSTRVDGVLRHHVTRANQGDLLEVLKEIETHCEHDLHCLHIIFNAIDYQYHNSIQEQQQQQEALNGPTIAEHCNGNINHVFAAKIKYLSESINLKVSSQSSKIQSISNGKEENGRQQQRYRPDASWLEHDLLHLMPTLPFELPSNKISDSLMSEYERGGQKMRPSSSSSSASSSSSSRSANPTNLPTAPNFLISILDQSNVLFKVHDWLLYARWVYFRNMIGSGMTEANNRHAELPVDFPPTLLSLLIRVLYGHPLKLDDLLVSDCEFLLENGAEYYLFGMDGVAVPPFSRLLSLARHKMRATFRPDSESGQREQ